MENRYNTLDNSSPIVDQFKNIKIDVPRSSFNFSCMKYFNGFFGALMPFDIIRTLPNEDYTIQYDVLAKLRNPLVRPLLTGCRIYIHTYYNRCSDLWEGADNFFTKGRSGTIDLRIPSLNPTISYQGQQSTFVPLAPSSYMGLPSLYYDSSVNQLDCYKPITINDSNKIGDTVSNINALPFVMYQRLYRDKYAPKNLLYKNTNMYPDNEDHFILPYSISDSVSRLSYTDPSNNNYVSSMNWSVPVNSDDYPVALNAMRFRQFKGDYFTTANPFVDMIRGNAPTINISDIDIDIVNTVDSTLSGNNIQVRSRKYLNPIDGLQEFSLTATAGSGESSTSWNIYNEDGESDVRSTSVGVFIDNADLQRKLAQIKVNSVATAQTNGILNLNDFRALEAYTIFMERNARTDGDYNNLIKAQFGFNPNKHNREAIYIGGCYQDMVFSDVTQTSQSSDDSPLGQRAGQGISANSGYIGKFHSNDYGYIMSIMSIVPDTVYTQGVNRMWTEVNQSDQYFPILNNLSPQAILNQELYITGSDSDNDIFGYQERYAEYKSRTNEALGFFALPSGKSIEDESRIMRRRFTSTPTLSADFITLSPDNVDMTPFTSITECPFELSVACRVDKVSPMPYVTVPGGLSARA